MVHTPLTALQPRDRQATIQVHVSRKWEFRGTTDKGPIQHIDMVFTDEQGNAIYAEIPGPLAEQKSPLIDQDKVYIIARFKVTTSKTKYRPVDAQFMIQFTLYTTVILARNPPSTFPKYVYSLTPFDEIEAHVGIEKNFLDVLGIVTEVHSLRPIHISGQPDPTITRDIILKDLDNKSLRITLWANRAAQFNIDTVYNATTGKPVVALFVGCLPKRYQNSNYLSGNAACHWYFNPTIIEAEIYYTRLHDSRVEIQCHTTPTQQPLQPYQSTTAEHKFLSELQDINPYDFPESGYQCTVTIARLPENDIWWFPSCNRCNKSCTRDHDGYICELCNWREFKFKYKLTFIASDGTAEAQMFCFDNIARRIVGKSCEAVVKSMKRSSGTPPDLAAIVSQKFTFAVSITDSSFDTMTKVFRIESIITSHGRQRTIPQITDYAHQEGPTTPLKISTAIFPQDTPTTAMKGLTTATASPTDLYLTDIQSSQLPSKPDESSSSIIRSGGNPTARKQLFGEENIVDKDVNDDNKAVKAHDMTESKQQTHATDAQLSLGSPPKRSKVDYSKEQQMQSASHKSANRQKNH